MPPPPGVASPIYWGMEARVRDLFPSVRSIRATRKDFVFRYQSTAHFLDMFRRFYGPTHKAFAALDQEGQARLTADITALCDKLNRQKTSLAVPAEYLEIVIER